MYSYPSSDQPEPIDNELERRRWAKSLPHRILASLAFDYLGGRVAPDTQDAYEEYIRRYPERKSKKINKSELEPEVAYSLCKIHAENEEALPPPHLCHLCKPTGILSHGDIVSLEELFMPSMIDDADSLFEAIGE